MVGVRKVKHFTAIVLLLGLTIITLSYRSFFHKGVARSQRASHRERRKELLSQGLQAAAHVLGKKLDQGDTAAGSAPQHSNVKRPDEKNAADVKRPDDKNAADVMRPGDKHAADAGRVVQHMQVEAAESRVAAQEPGVKKPAGGEKDWVRKAAGGSDVQSEWEKMKQSIRQEADEKRAQRQRARPGPLDPLHVTRPPMDQVKPLHRIFSFSAINRGNVYGTSYPAVVHVAVFCQRDDFSATLTLVNSIVTNTRFPNLTFHFVTPPPDRLKLKAELDKVSHLEKLAFEIVAYPVEWAHGKNMMEFATFRLPDLLPYNGGRLAVLAPHCLVTGDITDLVNTPLRPGHWAAMPTLCTTQPHSNLPDERYGQYVNVSHPLVSKLRLKADTCVPSPAVMVVNMSSLRLTLTRPKLWRWVRLSDQTPVFLKSAAGEVSSKAAYAVVFHNHTTPLKPQWYTRLNEKSPAPDGKGLLYHWVGKGKPWQQGSPAASLWNKYLIQATT